MERAECIQLPAGEEFLDEEEDEEGAVIQNPVDNPPDDRALEGAQVFVLIECFLFHKLLFKPAAEKTDVIPA